MIDNNLFCHGAVLLANGHVFTAGGDTYADIMRTPAATGLQDGIKWMRDYDPATNTWGKIGDMNMARWYPTIVRLVDGRVLMIGGAVDGTVYAQQYIMEVWLPGRAINDQIPLNVLAETGTALYPQCTLIPHTGNVFMFTYSKWAIIDKVSLKEIEREQEITMGIRGGEFTAGAVLLPMTYSDNYKGEFIMFGGGAQFEQPWTAIDTVARIVLTTDGPKHWTYDTERIPYERVVANVVIQPNGKLLIMNGGRLGKTGAPAIGQPNTKAETMHVFCYDPLKPDGQRWSVMAESPIRRLYHSSGVLVPDGRTLIMGTDEASFLPRDAYEHRVEAFTLPWLLDGTPRPVITDIQSGIIAYNSVFSVSFTGKVTGVAIITPSASTHGVEFLKE